MSLTISKQSHVIMDGSSSTNLPASGSISVMSDSESDNAHRFLRESDRQLLDLAVSSRFRVPIIYFDRVGQLEEMISLLNFPNIHPQMRTQRRWLQERLDIYRSHLNDLVRSSPKLDLPAVASLFYDFEARYEVITIQLREFQERFEARRTAGTLFRAVRDSNISCIATTTTVDPNASHLSSFLSDAESSSSDAALAPCSPRTNTPVASNKSSTHKRATI